ncbi:MAG TPA: hydrogenase maturation nickel metallochaperone HypA [Acidobacteriaceae bacterium]|nr:hydrogenase maturation nickel metallochaperone HypA [Acidobacteriaceae bacterium]
MHELSIAISMIDQVLEESASRGGLDIEAVHLKLGIFSGVDKEALLFAYGMACEGSPLQGSRLVIESIPLVIYCEACQKERIPPSVYEISCPDCGTPGQKIVSGREIEVAALELA